MSEHVLKYKDYLCRLMFSRYTEPPNPIAMWLESARTMDLPSTEDTIYEGEQIATATVYVEGTDLAPDEVLIKSWSENEGMAKALQAHGVIGPVLRKVPTGYCEATVHRLLIEPTMDL